MYVVSGFDYTLVSHTVIDDSQVQAALTLAHIHLSVGTRWTKRLGTVEDTSDTSVLVVLLRSTFEAWVPDLCLRMAGGVWYRSRCVFITPF